MAEKIFRIVLIIVVFCIFAAVIAGFVYAITWGIDNEANRITQGVVIDKDFNAGYTSTSGSKDSGISIYHHPASYNLLIEGRKDGQVVQYWKEVTAEEYAKYNIGDYYGHE